MTIAYLDTPLRVTWELSPQGEAPALTAALTVAERLAEAGLFYVTLQRSPLAHPEISTILAILKEGGVQVEATFGGSDAEWAGVAALKTPPPLCVDANLFLADGSDEEWSALGRVIGRLRTLGTLPALMMVPDRQRLPLLPRLCAFARSSGVTRIKLPNTPVDASFSGRKRAALPDPEALARLAAAIPDPLGLRAGLTLEIHDLFLWEILFPGERESGRSEYGGCQAANSLAHVDSFATVHPCSSWPQELGSLLASSFAEIWQQEERFALLARIAACPGGCQGCSDYLLCFGGCRGLVETLGSATSGRDLLCPGVRSSAPHGCD